MIDPLQDKDINEESYCNFTIMDKNHKNKGVKTPDFQISFISHVSHALLADKILIRDKMSLIALSVTKTVVVYVTK